MSQFSGPLDLSGVKSRQEYLPNEDYIRKAEGLSRYLKQFGTSIVALSEKQLLMFIVASNLNETISRLNIRSGEQIVSSTVKGLGHSKEGQLNRPGASNRHAVIESAEATDLVEIGPIRDLSELTQVLPGELAYMQLEPDLLTLRALSHELLVVRWQRDGDGKASSPNIGDSASLTHILPKSEESQLYILLDTSESMNLGMDRSPDSSVSTRKLREIVARGYTLEAMRQASRRGIPINFRNFSDHIGEHRVALTEMEFKELAKHVLTLPNTGRTDIQGILDHTAKDIASGKAPHSTGVILVTDGYSRLNPSPDANPLQGLELHTTLVGFVSTGRDIAPLQYAEAQYAEKDRKIKYPQ